MKKEIAEAIKKLAGLALTTFVIGKVESVDGRTCTVNPVDGGAALENVRLNAYSDGDQGLIITPKEDTFVIVGMISEVDAMVLMCYEIESVDIVLGETTFKMQDGETLFNGGSNGGFIKVSDLVSKINDLENDINSLKQAFFTWVPVTQDGGAALKTAAGSWAGQQFVNTQAADIENTDIKH
jgi:hypothetical protein